MTGHTEEVICDGVDDDVVNSVILQWAELDELWDEHANVLDRYSVVDDVLSHCSHVEIDTEEWDADVPGRSGELYFIRTGDAAALKREMRERIEGLILPVERPTVPARPEDTVPAKREALVRLLGQLAAQYDSTRGPAGYRGATKPLARSLREAAARISSEQLDDAAIRALLSQIVRDPYLWGVEGSPLENIATGFGTAK